MLSARMTAAARQKYCTQKVCVALFPSHNLAAQNSHGAPLPCSLLHSASTSTSRLLRLTAPGPRTPTNPSSRRTSGAACTKSQCLHCNHAPQGAAPKRTGVQPNPPRPARCEELQFGFLPLPPLDPPDPLSTLHSMCTRNNATLLLPIHPSRPALAPSRLAATARTPAGDTVVQAGGPNPLSRPQAVAGVGLATLNDPCASAMERPGVMEQAP